MSKADEIKEKMLKKDPRSNLIGLAGAGNKGAAENEAAAAASENENKTGLNLDAIAAAFHNEVNKEPAKKLKGIYLDEDVLEVYEAQARLKPRGWGSQMVNDLLRAVFEQQGLLPKK